MKNLINVFGVAFVVVLAIALIGIGPIFTIWSLNLLFSLAIPVTVWTWLSVAWLSAFFAVKLKS